MSSSKIRIVVLLYCIGLLLIVGRFIYLKNYKQIDSFVAASKEKIFERYADRIFTQCKKEKYPITCYDREIPKLMEKPAMLSMENAFIVTKLIQQKDPSFAFCHVAGHRLSGNEVKKDPSKWKEVVTRCPSGVCSNGCIHGGFQERFRTDTVTPSQLQALKPEVATLCEKRQNWEPTGIEQASCYHALGHLLMYLTNADIRSALTVCDEIALKQDGRDLRQLCYDGVFMLIFQPLEPEDFALVKGKQPTKEQVPAFCGEYSGKYKISCITESWPLFKEELMSVGGINTVCSHEVAAEKERCHLTAVYALVVLYRFDVNKLINYCDALESPDKDRCMAFVAIRFLVTDYNFASKAVNICKEAEKRKAGEECYNALVHYSTYNFHAGSDEFFQFCETFTEPWKSQCLEKGKDHKS
jgi:hypothetical protein